MTDRNDVGPPIEAELRDRAKRRDHNAKIWIETQGAKIKAARPAPVYSACLLMALERCHGLNWQYLTPHQIAECEGRALAASRSRMFGRLPPTNVEYDAQLEQVRAAWEKPQAAAA